MVDTLVANRYDKDSRQMLIKKTTIHHFDMFTGDHLLVSPLQRWLLQSLRKEKQIFMVQVRAFSSLTWQWEDDEDQEDEEDFKS